MSHFQVEITSDAISAPPVKTMKCRTLGARKITAARRSARLRGPPPLRRRPRPGVRAGRSRVAAIGLLAPELGVDRLAGRLRHLLGGRLALPQRPERRV